MYLSCLLVDLGDNPDRIRPGRSWIRNLYRVHQRLCMAFPSADRVENDGDFLQPYEPEQFANGHVHVRRGGDTGFLFRIDPQSLGRAVILVQSAIEPNWDYAFHNACGLLASAPQIREYNPEFKSGQPAFFRLMANPTRRLSRNSIGLNGEPVTENWVGKRVPVANEQLAQWLIRRIEPWAQIEEDKLVIQPGYISVSKNEQGFKEQFRSARYDGTLKITDPKQCFAALQSGIGSAKAFGFGLLSIAPAEG